MHSCRIQNVFLFLLNSIFLLNASGKPTKQYFNQHSRFKVSQVANDSQNKGFKRNHQPLKILMVVYNFPRLSETFILNQITGLLDQGHEVYIYADKRNTETKIHDTVIKYDLLSKTYYGSFPPDIESFDVIICQYGMIGAKQVTLKKNPNLKSKIVCCFRGMDASLILKRNPHYYDRLFKEGDLFLPVSNYFKKRLIEHGCNPNKILVSYSGIDCSKFMFKIRTPNPDGSIRIVTTARFCEKKGIEYAIEAFAKVLEQNKNLTYTIIGWGHLEEKLRNLVTKLKIEKYVEFPGPCTKKEVAKILDNSHIFILPSVTEKNGNQEGIPDSLKEAMALGLPVISTYHSGIPELVDDGKSGFLVPERDVDTLANRLEHLVTHPEIWPNMGSAGRKKVEEEHNNEKVIDTLETILLDLVHEKK